MIPSLLLVDDVAEAFSTVVTAAAAARQDRPLRLACSGGTTGRACVERLAKEAPDLSGLEVYVVDERCVTPGSPDANERTLREAFGTRLGELAGFHPMRCAEGAEAYEATLRAAGGLDLVQLGVGPDGHTASLFPGSPALDAPSERLVVGNEDPSGRNPHARLTLTYGAIAATRLVLVTVFGPEKHEVLTRLAAGEDLPAARLPAEGAVWLVDAPAVGALTARPAGAEALAAIGRSCG